MFSERVEQPPEPPPPSVIEGGLGEDGFSLNLSFSQSQPWHGRPLD